MQRPIGLIIVAVLLCAEAVYNVVISFELFGPQDVPAYSFLDPTLVLQDGTLRLFLPFFSVIFIFVAYEVLVGGFWSYVGGLAVSAFNFVLYADIAWLYYTAPPRMDLTTPLLNYSLGLSFAYVVMVWGYFNVPHVRKYLTRWM